ncbi:MAG: hypothetical protein ACLGIR_12900 [Actinomycetes bacterium]
MTAAAGVAVVLGAGCTAGAEPSADPTQRLEEVRAARDVVAEVVPPVRAAADVVVAAVRPLRDGSLATVPERLEALERLDAVLADGVPVVPADLVAGEGPDVEAARAALSRLRDAVDDLRRAADAEASALRELQTADAALADLVASWDRPGSRSQLLDQLAESEGGARALAEELDAEADVLDCLATFDRRATAADVVAERTAELADEVRARDGLGFDELRDGWRPDPFDTAGAPLGAVPTEEVGCWEDSAPLLRASSAIDEALDALEGALTPADLSGP